MPRIFNTTGPCHPERHYMLPPLGRMPQLHRLIEEWQYFILHAPRQVGKTTAMMALARQLRERGTVALHASLLGARGMPEKAESEVVWLTSVALAAEIQLPEAQRPPSPDAVQASPPGTRLQHWLRSWCQEVKVPVVLLLDEADAVQGEAMMSLLAQLRNGFDYRGPEVFPTSVGLIGLRSLRDYIVEVRGRPLAQSSPFNNAISLTLRNFNREEVASLYAQHTDDTGQLFLPETVDAVMYWTGGQPLLVNALARHAVGELVPDRTLPIRPEHIEQSKDALIGARVTHLDHLAERLNEPRVARILLPILLGEGEIASTTDDFEYCVDLGLIHRSPVVAVSNPIYREVLARQLTQSQNDALPELGQRWRLPNGQLDFAALIEAFRQFWRENADILMEQGGLYREAAPQLVLMAFLQRVVNGGGRITREYAAGRGRIDLLIELRGGRHVVEMKRARSDATLSRARRDGLEQLGGYLDSTGVSEGWLLIFDLRAERSWEERLWSEDLEQDGKILHLRGV